MLTIPQKFLILKKRGRGGGIPVPQTLSQFLLSYSGTYQSIDATDANNVSLNSGNISQITDLSGNNKHLVEATASKQPLYSIGGLNGKNAIYFDGVNDCLTTAGYLEGTFTKFYVCNFQSPAGFTEEVINGSNYTYFYQTNNSAVEVNRNGVVSNLNVGTNWGLGLAIFCWQFDGTSAGHRVWKNGVLLATSTSLGNPGINEINSTLNLGSRNNGASNPSKGFLAIRHAYSRSMSNTEINEIFTRLNTEFTIY